MMIVNVQCSPTFVDSKVTTLTVVQVCNETNTLTEITLIVDHLKITRLYRNVVQVVAHAIQVLDG